MIIGLGRILLCLASLMSLLVPAARGQIVTLSGFVFDTNGSPVVDADLDFDDAATGRRIYTPNDNTDQNGFYRVTILAGTYHISYAPPLNTHLLGRRYFNYVLNQSQVLDVTLNGGLVISGTVRDSLGQPLVNVDFDLDSLGAGRVYTPNDASGPDGSYWLVTPPGSFRMRLSPPPATRFRGLEIDTIVIGSDVNRDFVMSQGWLLSGIVTNSAGIGQDTIQIGIRDFITGAKIFVANNKTDTVGAYSVAIPSGALALRYTPPYGSRLVAAEDSIVMAQDRTRNQVLLNGLLINLNVVDSSGAPIAGVDFDFTDETTGIRAFMPYDLSNSFGRTIASLMPDTYTVRVDPPPGSLFDRLTLTGIPVLGDTSFTFVLPEVQRVSFAGRLVSGSGSPIGEIAIELRSSISHNGVSLSGNISDTLGYFNVAVPTGLFDVSFAPPRGSRFAGSRFFEIEFANDTVWNDIALDTGAIFSALVIGPDGSPLADVDFDFALEPGGDTIFTPHDNTDISGRADITVRQGTYTVILTPPAIANLDSKIIGGVNIARDTSASFMLTANGESMPGSLRLWQNYPNPFNDMTSITFTMLIEEDVSLNIYNVLGRRIRAINAGRRVPGLNALIWDGRDDSGDIVASGLYFYQIKTASATKTKKMMFIK